MATRLWRWFDEAPRQRTGIRMFQIAMAIAVIVRCFTELPHAAWMFGPHGLGEGTATTFFGPIGRLLDPFFSSGAGVVALFAIQLAAGLALLLGRATRVAIVTLLLTCLSFEQRFPEITDGGDNLLRLALVYMVLVVPVRADAAAGSVRCWLHNMGVVLLGGQVLVLYFTAGIMKAQGAPWYQGTALYLVSQVEWISLPGLRDVFKHAAVTVLASYATVLWQVSFPIGVLSRFKLVFVAIGLFFHLGIGVFMGLVTFSTMMIGAEAFLLDDAEWRRIAAWLRRGREALIQRVPAMRPVLGGVAS